MRTHIASPHPRGRLASAVEPEPDQPPPVIESLSPREAGRLLGVDDVAGLLGVPRTFVYALARRGELPTVRVGERYVRFRAQAIQEWIVGQESSRPRGVR